MNRKALLFGVPAAIFVASIVLGLALAPLVYPKPKTEITATTGLNSIVASHNEEMEIDMQRFVLVLIVVVSGAAASAVTGFLLSRRR